MTHLGKPDSYRVYTDSNKGAGWVIADFCNKAGEIRNIELIARGVGVHDRARLRKYYGQSRWRKLKGFATVRLTEGTVHTAELHWYEAHGIGRKEFKIKFPLLD